jgi:hypothetical protein
VLGFRSYPRFPIKRHALMRTTERQNTARIRALIRHHQPIDRRDLETLADREGMTGAEVEQSLTALGPEIVEADDGDLSIAPAQESRSRGLSPKEVGADSERRADLARENHATELDKFRSDHLGGDPLGADQVASWIEARIEEPTTYETKADAASIQVERRTLEYAVVGSDWVQRVPIAQGSVLDELRSLSEAIARESGWQPAQATSFVLADVTPVVPVTRITTRRTFGASRRAEVSATEVHPHQEPEAVARYLRQVRKREGFRQRRPEPRQVALAD